jgi:hypothetical protein
MGARSSRPELGEAHVHCAARLRAFDGGAARERYVVVRAQDEGGKFTPILFLSFKPETPLSFIWRTTTGSQKMTCYMQKE